MMRALLDVTVLGDRLSHAGQLPLKPEHADWLSVLAGFHDVGSLCGDTARAYAGLVNVMVGRDSQPRLRDRLLGRFGEDVDDAVAILRATTCFDGAVFEENSRAKLPASFAVAFTALDDELADRFPKARPWPGVRQYPAARLLAGLVAMSVQLCDGWAGESYEEALGRLRVLGLDRKSIEWPEPGGSTRAGGPSVVVFEGPVSKESLRTVLDYGFELVRRGRVDNIVLACRRRVAALHVYESVREIVGAVPVVRGLPLDVEPSTSWWTERTWRYLMAPIAVTTHEQVFNSVRIERHAYLRSASLARALVVMDDVYASSPRDMEMAKAVVQHQVGLVAGYAAVTSAAMHRRAREELLLERFATDPPENEFERVTGDVSMSDQEQAIADAYPASWTGLRNTVSVVCNEGPPLRSEFRHVTVIGQGLDEVVEAAVRHAKRGERVLVVRNAHADALETARAIVDKSGRRFLLHVNGHPVVFHPYYTAEDRHAINVAALRAFESPPTIVVTTSQVDSGLHFDVDALVTDLSPVDVMVRRLWRVVGGASTVYVVRPPVRMFVEAVGPKGEARRLPMGVGTVYKDMAVLHRTWENLRRRGGIDRGQPRLDIEEALHPYHMRWLSEPGTRWVEHRRWLARREERVAVVAASLRWSGAGGSFGTRDCDVRTSSPDHRPREVYIEGNLIRVYFSGIESPIGTPMRQLDVRGSGGLKPGQVVRPDEEAAGGGWSFGGGHVYDSYGYRWMGGDAAG